MSLQERFQRKDVLVDALARQKIVNGDHEAAAALADAGELVEFEPGCELMAQGAGTDEAFFLLSGSVEIWVNGKLIPYQRKSGEVVGEFAAINPELKRTATIVAATDVLALRCSSADLIQAADKAKSIWRLLAIDLTRKVEQRNQLIKSSNDRPSLFLVASEEQRAIADHLDSALSAKFNVTLWHEADLAPPGTYELERLNEVASEADFAIVLAHPDDLQPKRGGQGSASQQSVLFELGYLINELGRRRTLLLVPEEACESSMPEPFKGLDPWCFPALTDDKPAFVTLGKITRRIEDYVTGRKVRSRLSADE